MRIVLIAPSLFCVCLLFAAWLRVEPHAPFVAPLCQYGGGQYNPVWYGPCPTATSGPAVFSVFLGVPNPTETPWSAP